MRKNNYKGVEPYIVSSAHNFSLKLIKSGLFLFSDINDLEQELLFHCVRNLNKFDSSKSSFEHFVTVIIENKYKDILRKANAKNRCSFFYSLEESVFNDDSYNGSFNEESTTYKDLIASHYDSDLSMELSADIEMLFNNKLSDEYKNLFRLLQTHSFEEIAHELDVAPRTIYNMVNRLKEYFKEAGLDEYL